MTKLMTFQMNDSVESISSIIIVAIKIIKLQTLIRIFFLQGAGRFSVHEAQDVLIISVSNALDFFPLPLYYYQMLSDCGVCS